MISIFPLKQKQALKNFNNIIKILNSKKDQKSANCEVETLNVRLKALKIFNESFYEEIQNLFEALILLRPHWINKMKQKRNFSIINQIKYLLRLNIKEF